MLHCRHASEVSDAVFGDVLGFMQVKVCHRSEPREVRKAAVGDAAIVAKRQVRQRRHVGQVRKACVINATTPREIEEGDRCSGACGKRCEAFV
jgi:hypothetical protein